MQRCSCFCYLLKIPHSALHSPGERQLSQISQDKNVNFRYATAAFLVASGDYPTCLRQASLLNPGLCYVVLTYPETGALYAVSVRRLITLHSGLPLPLVVLACGSPYASLQPFRPFLTETPLPSANTFVNILKH